MIRKLLHIADDVLDWTVVGGYDRTGYYMRKQLWDESDTAVSMTGKVCAITGANAGLGKATATHLSRLGATVLLLCRNQQRGEQALEDIYDRTGNGEIHLEIVDMSDQQSIRECAVRLQNNHKKLDVLINNAGVLLDSREMSVDGIEMTFSTNVLGYFLLTNLLVPLLQGSTDARIVNVSSGGMYSTKIHPDDLQFEKRPYDGVKAYAESKRAEVILTELWAEKLRNKSIFVSAMHPGWADTLSVRKSLPRFYLLTKPILRTAEEGADTIVWLSVCGNLRPADSGKFWCDRKQRATHRLQSTRNSDAEIKEFRDYCCELTQS